MCRTHVAAPPPTNNNTYTFAGHAVNVHSEPSISQLFKVTTRMDVETALSPEIAIVSKSWQEDLDPPQEPKEAVEYPGAPGFLGDAVAGVKSPTSDPSTRCKLAVDVRGLELWYGAGEDKVEIFKGINVKVPRGVIYALLGSSGCGKTTLLRVILGRKPFQKGHIRVFGLLPGTPGSKIPGSNVGYMPQELALYDSFSIQETLVFFSRLYNLPKTQIEERIDFLLEFLELPERTRLVHYLSWGQKRRVSLAAALVHSPPLLILDEPTVGIDPVLRKSIWEHLVTLAAKDKMTIIITTHYIDEARLAGQVGFLRQGKLLAEAPPEDLMRGHNASNLEEVFLQLAQGEAQDSSIHPQANVFRTLLGRASSHFHHVSDSEYSFMQSVTALTTQEHLITRGKDLKRSWARTSAILYKNMINFRRSYSLLLYSFLLPSIEVMIFVAVVGRTPFGLTLATVNEDNGTAGIGASFLKLLDGTVMPQVEHTDLGQALESVSSGRAYGAIHIGGNFSTTFETRFGLAGGYHISEDQARMSTISLHLDMSNQQILMTINFYLRKASEALLNNYFQARNMSTGGLNSVVEVRKRTSFILTTKAFHWTGQVLKYQIKIISKHFYPVTSV
ncbi:ABC transporter G family member 23-like [Ixodes scapularis]|uniref:ABC transporter G family member 23-like n=1 Tax=Ixodes scapularis TaxID=6945 RepID=UPI001C388692|nr:ABC transporter G family member 23-like [Ixodes scapularis]